MDRNDLLLTPEEWSIWSGLNIKTFWWSNYRSQFPILSIDFYGHSINQNSPTQSLGNVFFPFLFFILSVFVGAMELDEFLSNYLKFYIFIFKRFLSK
jgi:hypothetical protein